MIEKQKIRFKYETCVDNLAFDIFVNDSNELSKIIREFIVKSDWGAGVYKESDNCISVFHKCAPWSLEDFLPRLDAAPSGWIFIPSSWDYMARRDYDKDHRTYLFIKQYFAERMN